MHPFDRAADREVDDELAFHLERRIADYVRQGMTPDEAKQAALARFGDMGAVRTACTELLVADRRATERRDWRDDVRQDVRYGMRSALRAPLFSLLAVVTLALGIGANAAVFGVVKSVLLDALPYTNADRLVRVYARRTDGSLERSSVSAGALTDMRERLRSFASIGAFANGTNDITYASDAGPVVVSAAFPAHGFFETLGTRAQLGRTLRDADVTPGAPPVAMISHDAWQRLFGGARDVVGRTVRLSDDATQIVGVLPRGFVAPHGTADFWLPLDLTNALADPVRRRQQHWLGMVARLKPSVSRDAADRDLQALSTALAHEHPESDRGIGYNATMLRDAMVGDTRTPLLVLMASAGLVLLITCANIAGALLSRTVSRRKEFAVRVALGGGGTRLVRQLLTESTLLAMTGGAVGLGLAAFGLALLRRLQLPALPPYATLSMDPGAIAITFAVALITGAAFGLAPALSAARANPQGVLREEARGASEGRRTRRLRGLLVAGQIALCVSLLAGAGLLARSLWAISSAPLGFDADRVLTAGVQAPSRTYPTTEARARFFLQLEERLRAMPGVVSVANTSELPSPNLNRNGLTIEGVTWPEGSGPPFINYVNVSDEYFKTMRIPLRRGRVFGPTERIDTPTAIVISEAMARRYWPNANPIGAHVRLGPDLNAPWNEIVGVVGDVRNDASRPTPEPMAYGSIRQQTFGYQMFVIRTSTDPQTLVKAVQRELTALDPSLPLHDTSTLQALLAGGLAGRRLPVVLMTAFGALALALASVGVYAMFASMAAAREREFGVRIALGSTRFGIASQVIGQGATWMSLGLLGGVGGVVVVSRALRELLYGVTPFDPLTLGVTMAVLIVCAALALLAPVRRATRADPISALR